MPETSYCTVPSAPLVTDPDSSSATPNRLSRAVDRCSDADPFALMLPDSEAVGPAVVLAVVVRVRVDGAEKDRLMVTSRKPATSSSGTL